MFFLRMLSQFRDFVLQAKIILNYLEKLFTNEKTEMNTPYLAVVGRGS